MNNIYGPNRMDKNFAFLLFKKLKENQAVEIDKKASEIIFVFISLRFKSINPKFNNKTVRNIKSGRNWKFKNFIKKLNLFLFSKIYKIPKYIFIENKDKICKG